MRLFFILFLVFTGNAVIAQNSNKADTASGFVHKMQKRGQYEAVKSVELYNREKIAIHQRNVMEHLKRLNQQIKISLKSETVDTIAVQKLLNHTNKAIVIVKDGIFTNKGSYQTQRNLVVSAAILTELSKRLSHQKKLLDDFAGKALDMRIKLDSLQGDPLMYSFSSDSLEITKYIKSLTVVVKALIPIDHSLNKSLSSLQALQVKVDLMAFELQTLKEEVEMYSSNLSAHALNKEFPYLWAPAGFSRPIAQIIQLSRTKESMILQYYAENNVLPMFILLVLICGSFYFIRSLKLQLLSDGRLSPDHSGQLLVRHSLLSAILLTLCIFQFVFSQPPFMLSFSIWLISALCLTVIFHNFITRFWMEFWLVMLVFFVAASLDNTILQTSRMERYFTALLSLAGVAYTGFILFSSHRRDLKEKNILYFITFVFLWQTVAFLLNIFGRVNLSKTFLVSGYTGVVIAILFLWVIRLVNEGLTQAADIYKRPNRQLFFINFKRVGGEAPTFFYVLLILGWFFLVGKNFYEFKKFYEPIVAFFTSNRVVGSYSFSIMELVIFFLILVCSVFLSKLVSFFASEPAGTHEKTDDDKRFKLGSYILLVRIFIICIGLFFAFAAAGISLDKITIILGALGVGIGLGLQGLVNNLVSGLIISFERPVNVGDLIEINGKTAIMKSIGFRSSVIQSSEGASIIIPNGELLNQQLVNWTMGNNLKRNSIVLGIALGTDLEKVKTQLTQIVSEDERILTYPPAEVSFNNFNDSLIDVEVVFWPKHLSLSKKVKSDLIFKIDAVFKREGIVIAFKQYDVHIQPASDAIKSDNKGTE